jgi:two-component system, NtrC family, response regulator AlgB
MAKQQDKLNILIVDDEASLRRTLRIALESMGHHATEAANSAQALDAMKQDHFDLAFLDLRLGKEKGLDVLPSLQQAAADTHIVIVTAYASLDSAIEAMRRGAFDYLPKPFTPDQIRVVLDRSALVRGLRNRIVTLEDQVRSLGPDAELQSQEKSMQKAVDVALEVAPSDATVLLRGESGVGKGVVARAIHARSKRAAKPFVTIHCPSLSAELLESNLFGHMRGSFTGAVRDTMGKVAAAEGGTLFLDEIGDIPLSLQAKLLRFLQDKEYERVGDVETRIGDVRIVAATNRNLETEVSAGRFREDLLYRLNVIEITLPPLRQRKKDIVPLARKLLGFFAAQSGKNILSFEPEAEEAIANYDWPGNVRELRNAIERAVIICSAPQIGVEHLPAQLAAGGSKSRVEIGGRLTLDQLEVEHIRQVLGSTSSLEEAAGILGIDPSTLYRKRKRFEL